jgi:phosphoesterase RecJ-like protein
MITKIIAEEKIIQVQQLLDKYDNIVIVTHVSPDGDAIGSSMGLYHYLVDMGNQVSVIVPNSFPQFLKWIEDVDKVIEYDQQPDLAEKLVGEAQLIFCLDFNVLKRIKDLGELVRQSKAKKVMVDHHPYPEDFANVTISYPSISSTSELIFRLICRMGDFDQISKAGAEAIYTGMMTDTGAFTYNSNSPEIYYIIGQLLVKGIDKDQIYKNVYHNYSEHRFRMMGYMLSEKMKIYPDQSTALLYLTKEEQDRFHRKKGDTEGFVNIPLSIKGIVFTAMFREDTDMIKLSFRSSGKFPSNIFAAEYFNGGGHLNAAGGEFYGTLEDAVRKFEDALPAYFKKYSEQ